MTNAGHCDDAALTRKRVFARKVGSIYVYEPPKAKRAQGCLRESKDSNSEFEKYLT